MMLDCNSIIFKNIMFIIIFYLNTLFFLMKVFTLS